jgi:hypothetical protein
VHAGVAPLLLPLLPPLLLPPPSPPPLPPDEELEPEEDPDPPDEFDPPEDDVEEPEDEEEEVDPPELPAPFPGPGLLLGFCHAPVEFVPYWVSVSPPHAATTAAPPRTTSPTSR